MQHLSPEAPAAADLLTSLLDGESHDSATTQLAVQVATAMPPTRDPGPHPHNATSSAVPELERLRTLLLSSEQQRIATLEAQLAAMHTQVAALERQLQEREWLRAWLAPLMGEFLTQAVRTSHDEVAEALYPVIGRAVLRAVSEAMRDLARSIDAKMQQQGQFFTRLRLRLRGVDPKQATLRSVLPFRVRDVLLIHRESGLLIQQLSPTSEGHDADLVSGMLSAIRAYVQDAFVPEADGTLDAISYGELRIVIEESSSTVLAVVLQGVEPPAFRHRMRQQLSAVQASCGPLLRSFNGDPIPPALTLPALEPLLDEGGC